MSKLLIYQVIILDNVTNQFDENYRDETPFNLHYSKNEVKEYGNISESETPNTFSEEAKVKTEYLAGDNKENSLTNKIFFQRHRELKENEPLKPHQRELIKEWLDIRNKLVRPLIDKLKISDTKAPTSSGLPPVKGSEYARKPLEITKFAPIPTGTTYWPVISKDEDSFVVSYRFGPNKGDVMIGRNTEREFGGKRLDERLHGAHDCYGRAGELVVSIEDGIFLDTIENFLGNTSAMYIQHPKDNPRIMAVYGEIKKESYKKYCLKKGDEVKAGQIIAELGITPGGWAMLHFETHDIRLKGIRDRLKGDFRKWKIGGKPPLYLLNPTEYLLAVRDQEIERRKQQGGVTREYESKCGTTHGYQCMFDWDTDLATISQNYLAGDNKENSLTNKIFFQRHRELKENEPLKPKQKEEMEEWMYILNNMVRPLMQKLKRKRT